MEGRAKK